MKKKYLIIISLAFVILLFLFSTISYAGSQKLNELQYDVILNEDGTAEVTEIWDIRVSETNTLFKTFNIDKSKYGGITDVTVEEITSEGQSIPFKDTKTYAYHVEKGGYYALTRTANNQFEIAWGVSIEDTENKIYKIKYKIYDAIKTYNDCSEFYWQFIGKENGISAKKVIGKITIPKEVTNIENLRAWAHGPLNGNVEILDNKTVVFEVQDLPSETMVELRVATLEEVFSANENIYETNKLDKIVGEETKWSNEANNKRQKAMGGFVVIGLIGFAIFVVFIIKIIKYAKILASLKKSSGNIQIEYFRDFPDDKATPAEAAFLYYYDKRGNFNANVTKIVSATILNLALKKVLTFEQGEKKEVYITLNRNVENINLKPDEQSIYNLLVNIGEWKRKKDKSESIEEKISMKDIEKYAKKHDTKFLSKIESLEKIAKTSQKEQGNFDDKLEKTSDKWNNKMAGYFITAFCSVCMIVIIIPLIFMIPCIICGILCGKIAKRTRILTKKGEEEKVKWKGLKKYMEEFSLLNEREVPELVLWEKYLVYATAFGVADKVIEQLKIKYPELIDENYMMNNGFTYMYMMNRINLNTAINLGVQKAYNSGINARSARNYSSGGGFGGGFSGGGRRWTAEVGRNGWQMKIP